MGMEEGTCWDEHWVLCGNQFDNKFHIKKKKVLRVTEGRIFLELNIASRRLEKHCSLTFFF